jgi:hypothetical protein
MPPSALWSQIGLREWLKRWGIAAGYGFRDAGGRLGANYNVAVFRLT